MPWSPRPLLLAAILLGRAVPFSLPAPRVAASRLAPHRVASSPQLGLGKLLTRARTKLTDRVVSKLDVRLDRYRARRRPKRIILVRHGQSMGNTNRSAYASVPDSRIPLTERGFAQGAAAGMQIRKLVGNETTRFYYSPYLRARQTLVAILQAFTGQEVDVQAEPRLREQDFGNFQNAHEMDAVMSERQKFGRFYYRFPNGEAGTDVYDRVSDYLTSLFSTMDGRLLDGGRWRNVENQYDTSPHVPDNLVLVTHGLLMRIFCMCYFRWTPSEFEQVWNPSNCEVWVLDKSVDSLQYELTGRWRASPFGGTFVDIKYGANKSVPIYPHMKRPLDSHVLRPGTHGALDTDGLANLQNLPGPQTNGRSGISAADLGSVSPWAAPGDAVAETAQWS